ncbi:MAG: DUF5683 domain-containing protein [Chitinophagaceae bacterium]|nr:DUF5683 domain-containing protein [Chitinophagaceae bacterium]
MRKRHLILTFFLLFFARYTFAQNDTAVVVTPGADSIVTVVSDTVAKVVSAADTARKRSPARTATLLSAILPGAGQAYNKKYWKMPIVYGALAIPAYTFVDNLNWFNKTRFAYNIAFAKDTARYKEVDPRLLVMVEQGYTSSLQNYRNEFRRNVDYSVLVFMLLWGLNVVDAAVDAHLKDFNISDDLSIRIKPGYQPLANTAGIGIVLNIGKNPHHSIAFR